MSGKHWFDKDTLTQSPARTLTDDERLRAARYVASNAADAEDAALLLAMLGLSAAEGKRQESAA